jgi:hypothetical protein
MKGRRRGKLASIRSHSQYFCRLVVSRRQGYHYRKHWSEEPESSTVLLRTAKKSGKFSHLDLDTLLLLPPAASTPSNLKAWVKVPDEQGKV